MQPVLPLTDLGRRIMIFGPSNAGKSSLAVALGEKLGVPHVHLDLLHHQPGTQWEPRPKAEFDALHHAEISREHWVIEGNYMRLLPARATRATGVILLGSSRWSAFYRYVARTLFDKRRLGIHDGTVDRLNMQMTHFIMVEQPKKRQRDIALLRQTGLPMLQLDSMTELKALYRAWNLGR